MARSLSNIFAGVATLAALAILAAAPARAGAIEIDSALGCAESITLGPLVECLIPTLGAGTFTINNDTTDWDVTGFEVTDEPVPATVIPPAIPGLPSTSIPTDTVSASTTRTDWSAAANNIGVDPTTTCEVSIPDPIPGFPSCLLYSTSYGAYEPQFSYTGSGNYILPGDSDDSFDWQESSFFLDPTYDLDLVNADGVTDVCTGSLSNLSGSSSTCDPDSPAPTPEPSSLLLLGAALMGLSLFRWRDRKAV